MIDVTINMLTYAISIFMLGMIIYAIGELIIACVYERRRKAERLIELLDIEHKYYELQDHYNELCEKEAKNWKG